MRNWLCYFIIIARILTFDRPVISCKYAEFYSKMSSSSGDVCWSMSVFGEACCTVGVYYLLDVLWMSCCVSVHWQTLNLEGNKNCSECSEGFLFTSLTTYWSGLVGSVFAHWCTVTPSPLAQMWKLFFRQRHLQTWLGKCLSPYGNDWSFSPGWRIWILPWETNVLRFSSGEGVLSWKSALLCRFKEEQS